MRDALAPLVDAVALFMDNPHDEVREVVRARAAEPAAVPRRRRRRVLPQLRRAVPEGHRRWAMPVDAARPWRCSARYPGAAGFLFDSHADGRAGGSGQRLRLVAHPDRPRTSRSLLAGGLTAGQRVRRDPGDAPVGRGRVQRHRSRARASRTAIRCGASSKKCGVPTATSMPSKSTTTPLGPIDIGQRARRADALMLQSIDFHAYPDASGHFGRFGGRFVAETLIGPLEELAAAYDAARSRSGLHRRVRTRPRALRRPPEPDLPRRAPAATKSAARASCSSART